MSDEHDELAHLRKTPGRASRAAAKAAVNGGGWKQRKIEPLVCPSGEVVQVRRPGPEFIVRTGTAAQTFSKAFIDKAKEIESGMEADKAGRSLIDKLSDDEFAAMMIYGRQLVCEMVVSPRLVLNPRPGTNEVGPDDIGDDFWFLFAHAMNGFPGSSVPVGTQEVEVSDLESFRSEPGVQEDSADGAEIRTDAEQSAGDQGLVGGA